jgi:hypothetical protein
MAGESNDIFTNLPARYRRLPTSKNIEDRRAQPQMRPSSIAEMMAQSAPSPNGGMMPMPSRYPDYPLSPLGGQEPLGPPLPIGPEDLSSIRVQTGFPGAYGQSPYYSSGPHPAPPQPLQMPYGITPGSPGWMTPPSPSGPHPQTYPAGQGPQPPIFSPQGWSRPQQTPALDPAVLQRLQDYTGASQ